MEERGSSCASNFHSPPSSPPSTSSTPSPPMLKAVGSSIPDPPMGEDLDINQFDASMPEPWQIPLQPPPNAKHLSDLFLLSPDTNWAFGLQYQPADIFGNAFPTPWADPDHIVREFHGEDACSPNRDALQNDPLSGVGSHLSVDSRPTEANVDHPISPFLPPCKTFSAHSPGTTASKEHRPLNTQSLMVELPKNLTTGDALPTQGPNDYQQSLRNAVPRKHAQVLDRATDRSPETLRVAEGRTQAGARKRRKVHAPTSFATDAEKQPLGLDQSTSMACYCLFSKSGGLRPRHEQIANLAFAFDVPIGAIHHWFDNNIDFARPREEARAISGEDLLYFEQKCNSKGGKKDEGDSPQKRDAKRPYNCTYNRSGPSFANKHAWKRHEELHRPQKLWICPEKDCKARLPKKGLFTRLDRLRTHLSKLHPSKNIDLTSCQKILKKNFDKRCIFKSCPTQFGSWRERIEHLDGHFRNQWDWSEWRDDLKTDSQEAQNGEDEESSTDDDGQRSNSTSSDDTSDDGAPGPSSGAGSFRGKGDGPSQERKHGHQSRGNGSSKSAPGAPGTFAPQYHAHMYRQMQDFIADMLLSGQDSGEDVSARTQTLSKGSLVVSGFEDDGRAGDLPPQQSSSMDSRTQIDGSVSGTGPKFPRSTSASLVGESSKISRTSMFYSADLRKPPTPFRGESIGPYPSTEILGSIEMIASRSHEELSTANDQRPFSEDSQIQEGIPDSSRRNKELSPQARSLAQSSQYYKSCLDCSAELRGKNVDRKHNLRRHITEKHAHSASYLTSDYEKGLGRLSNLQRHIKNVRQEKKTSFTKESLQKGASSQACDVDTTLPFEIYFGSIDYVHGPATPVEVPTLIDDDQNALSPSLMSVSTPE